MPSEPEELTEGRQLLRKFEAEMGKPEGLVYLVEALSLLAGVRAVAESERIAQIASNVALTYSRKVQNEVELLLASDQPLHWETGVHWQNVFSEFERSGFPLDPEVAITRSKFVMKYLERAIASMSSSEKQEILERLGASRDKPGI